MFPSVTRLYHTPDLVPFLRPLKYWKPHTRDLSEDRLFGRLFTSYVKSTEDRTEYLLWLLELDFKGFRVENWDDVINEYMYNCREFLHPE